MQFNIAIIYSLQFVSSMAEFSSWGICENGILTGWGKPFFFSWFIILSFLNLLGFVKEQALTAEHPGVKTSFP